MIHENVDECPQNITKNVTLGGTLSICRTFWSSRLCQTNIKSEIASFQPRNSKVHQSAAINLVKWTTRIFPYGIANTESTQSSTLVIRLNLCKQLIWPSFLFFLILYLFTFAGEWIGRSIIGSIAWYWLLRGFSRWQHTQPIQSIWTSVERFKRPPGQATQILRQ